jgi:hypothetical protein
MECQPNAHIATICYVHHWKVCYTSAVHFQQSMEIERIVSGRMTTTRPIFTLRASLHGPVCRLREMAVLAISLSLPLFPFPYIPTPPSNLSLSTPISMASFRSRLSTLCATRNKSVYTSHCLQQESLGISCQINVLLPSFHWFYL